MTEIEQRIERAQHWRQMLDRINITYHWEWCIHVGLLETSGWTNNQHKMFVWLENNETKK